MTKILKNVTGSPITISDVGVTIAANSQITIAPQDYLLYAASSNVVTVIGAGTVVVNDGAADLSINQGTSLIQGNFPSSILSRTQDGAGTAVTSTLVSGKQGLDTNVTASALPAGASTSANQTTANASLSSIDTKTPALGQALAAASVPVVLTSSQLSTLTPLSTVAVTQSTSPWVTSRNWTLGSGTDSVSAVQSGTWNITNISGTVTLPTGAATETTLAAASAKLPASLGTKTGAASLSVVPNTDTPFPSSQSGVWNITNISGTVSLPTGASTSAAQTAGNNSLSSIDTKTPALGQALAAGSVPVVLTAAQLATLTPLTAVQANAGTNLNTSALSLETTQAAMSAKLPASLGAKTAAASFSVTPASDAVFVSQTDGPVAPGTVASRSALVGGQFTSTSPILANNQQAALQMNSSGELIVAQSLSSPTTDAMNRLRVSEPLQIFGSTFSLSEQRLSFNYLLTSGGTVTHVTQAAALRLATTTASGSSAIVQSKRYIRYTAGSSHMVHISMVVGAPKAGVRKRWGYFDDENGKFFEQTSTGISVVIRTSTSGSPVDTIIPQANWNLDKLDGTGPSGITLDQAKDNLYFLDFSWHGASRVRFGVLLNGIKIYCHQFIGSNTFTVPYTRSAFLPIRAELTNTGATASTTSMDFVACSAYKESSEPYIAKYNFARSTNRAFKNATASVLPFISIRPRLTFAGITNRVITEINEVQVQAGGAAVALLVIINPTLTGASFADVNTDFSSTQVDSSATALSGGVVIAEYFVPANSSQSFSLRDFSEAALLGLDIPGTTADVLTIALQSTAGNSSSGAAIRWGEYQ